MLSLPNAVTSFFGDIAGSIRLVGRVGGRRATILAEFRGMLRSGRAVLYTLRAFAPSVP